MPRFFTMLSRVQTVSGKGSVAQLLTCYCYLRWLYKHVFNQHGVCMATGCKCSAKAPRLQVQKRPRSGI